MPLDPPAEPARSARPDDDPLAALRDPPPTPLERAGRMMAALVAGRGPGVGALVGAAVVGAVAIAGALVWWHASSRPDETTAVAWSAGTTTVPMAATTVAPSPDLVVHAAGAVRAPGLYQLPAGSRVGDLVEAAGGPAPDADGDRVNLAAPLQDGERVYVPRVGEPVPSATPDAAGAGGAGGSTGGPTGPIDLNTAGADELDTLPGVGPTTAAAIIEYRKAHGRFGSVDELLEVRGIGPAKLDQLRSLVRV